MSHELKHHRPDDNAAARRLAHEIHIALGVDSRADAIHWNEVQSQAPRTATDVPGALHGCIFTVQASLQSVSRETNDGVRGSV